MGTPDLNQLAVFVAVARAGSFSGAARALGLPKSSISRAIAGLEGDMGVRLLHRTTRQVSLSTTGRALFERAAMPLAQLRASLGDLPELEDEPSGDLRVTAPVDTGTAILADVVARFTARYPAVRVDMWLTNRVVDIVGEGFDVAFRIWTRGRLKDSSLHAQKATDLAVQLFASPSYLARRGTPRAPADLADHDWVHYRGSPRIELADGGESAVVSGKTRVVFDDMFFGREVLRGGVGIGMLPAFLADGDVAAGTLVRVLPRWQLSGGAIWIVSPGGKHAPRKTQAFRHFALEALRSRPLSR